LIGEAGSGKASIVRRLAQRLFEGDVPENLRRAKLLQLELGNIIAGAKLRGEVEERLRSLFSNLASMPDREVILFVPDLGALFANSAGGMGELLKSQLDRGAFRMIGALTPEALKRMAEKESNVLRRMTELAVDPPDLARAEEIVRGLASRFEKHHGVKVAEGAIVRCVSLAKRYLQERFLPDSALDILDEACAQKRLSLEVNSPEIDAIIGRLSSLKIQLVGLENNDDRASVTKRGQIQSEITKLEPEVTAMRSKILARKGAVAVTASLQSELAAKEKDFEEAKKTNDFARIGELEHVTIPDIKRRLAAAKEAVDREGGVPAQSLLVDETDVAEIVAGWTGIPVPKMLEGEAEKLLKMESRLGERIIGQSEAVTAVSKAVRRGRVGLRDQGKPIGSFLLLGPSGVGKTELAKALAEFLFDDEQAMTRLDMSEFMEKQMAQRLVGAPPGYVDSEEGGYLTEAVRRRPYSVLLFDEVEKAHADVFNLLLQVLDDGRLTDGRGRLADFANTVVIMTSNIGGKRILETDPKVWETDDGRAALKDVIREDLREFFRPEFLNRVDDVIIFRPLSKDDLKSIALIQLKKLGRQLAEKELTIELTEPAKNRLVDLGYEPQFGARPLRRAILKEISDPIAQHYLMGEYPPGSKVLVDAEGESFVFKKG
jgi:ATP-dependent Clp protease ATP-binding subunit ClpB